ncbi:DUF433 domain-containing protein [Adhaeribacter arboris]|uniref:DUF433 domain-containing protein n=1 Tax=Adhaeribacter arboris TaxID=2072846 RepID=UPI0021D1C788|nr:DUF433 domain-containing protein [Adhaeribacter arboris]
MDLYIFHGKSTIRGLQYAMDNMLELLASGTTVEELLKDYPDSEKEAFLAYLPYIGHCPSFIPVLTGCLKKIRKQLVYILALVLGLWSCNSPITEKKKDKVTASKTQTLSAEKEQEKMPKVDNPTYDQIFLNGFSDYNEPYTLRNNFIITGQDTTLFPEDLPINRKTTFKGVEDSKSFLLTVTRTNLTNLAYTFELADKSKKTLETKSGKAVLSSMFFLASETDEDSETGDSYGSSEYWDKTNDCWLSIRIGVGLDDNGKQRAMLTYGCEDKNKQTLSLDECPTLRTE